MSNVSLCQINPFDSAHGKFSICTEFDELHLSQPDYWIWPVNSHRPGFTTAGVSLSIPANGLFADFITRIKNELTGELNTASCNPCKVGSIFLIFRWIISSFRHPLGITIRLKWWSFKFPLLGTTKMLDALAFLIFVSLSWALELKGFPTLQCEQVQVFFSPILSLRL